MSPDIQNAAGSAPLPSAEMARALSEAVDPDDAFRRFSVMIRDIFPSVGLMGISTEGLAPQEFRIAWHIDYDRRVRVEGPTFVNGGNREPILRGGFLGEVVEKAEPQLHQDIQVREDAALGDSLAPYRCVMAAPLYRDGRVIAWTVLLHRRPKAFTEEHLDQFVARANLIGGIFKNHSTAERLRDAVQQRHEEIERIAAIQRALLPDTLPEIPGVELDVSYETFDQAGGDFYILQPLAPKEGEKKEKDRYWGIIVGDVSGHGPAAAVVMAIVESLLVVYRGTDRSPARVLGYLNKHLCKKRIESSFVTAVAGVYDAVDRTFTYGCAGHPPILWQRPSGEDAVTVTRLDCAGGIPLGVLPETQYGEATVKLSQGDTLAFYTDGITEARAPDGAYFGVEGLQNAMHECAGDVFCVVERVMGVLKRHEAGGRPLDDQTLLAMQIMA